MSQVSKKMRRELNIWVVEEKCRGGIVEEMWAGGEAGRIEGQGGKQVIK